MARAAGTALPGIGSSASNSSRSGATTGQTTQGVEGRKNQAADASEKNAAQNESVPSSAQSSSQAASGQFRMPWERNPPDSDGSRFPLKDFPIGNLSRGVESDGTLMITGSFTVEGDAADADLLANMTSLYSSNGALADGRAWRTSIQFIRAAAGQTGDLQMNWMNAQFFAQHPSLNQQATGGYMDFGSRSMWLNKNLFDKALLTQSGLVPSRRIDAFNAYLRMFTPGHELFHGMGFGHARNSTGSLSSYARNPRLTKTDFSDMWNLLKENGR
jgi:hypothetical protein